MEKSVRDGWASDAEHTITEHERLIERQLALVDRVIGLEAELAQVSAISSLAPVDHMTVESELSNLRGSRAWRVGRMVVAPVAFAGRASRVLRRRVGL